MTIDKEFLLQYKKVQALAKTYKDKENAMRVQIADEVLKHKRAGTHHFDYDNVHLKGVKKYNITPNEDALNAIWPNLTEEEQACFKFKPSFLSSKYKELYDTSTVAQCIETKPAMPTFTVTVKEDS